MCRVAAFLLFMTAGLLSLGARDLTSGIVALQEGRIVYVRSTLSGSEDVVIPLHIGPANGQIIFGHTFLVPAETPMEPARMAAAKWPFHAAFDDATPWLLNGTYIGANHGANDVIRITSPAHGLSKGDLGSGWKDSNGTSFYLLEIIDENVVHLLSENDGVFPRWRFTRSIAGAELTNETSSRKLGVQASELVQLTPACRIHSQQFLADGKPLKQGVPTPCENFEVLEEYDIIAPDSVLVAVKKAPGQKVDYVADDRGAVINNRIRYHFQPAGACVIRHRATALRDFDLGYMGFIQSSPLHAGENSRLLSCIPKTLPFSSGGRDYDFRLIQDLSTPPSEPLIFSVDRGNVADAAKLPDRFIQILSEGKKQVGFVMGYSLLKGLTKPEVRAANTGSPVFIYTTGKTYPAAIDRNARPVKEGDTFDCLAYRQYFDPLSHPEATTVYRHNQDGDEMLYAEFHRRAKKAVLPFPKDLWGKKFEVVEKTDSVEIAAVGKIPSEGVPLEVRGVGGSVVLRVPCD